jgi:hypothetical protein
MTKQLLELEWRGLEKVISGGQQGVDIGGLIAAKEAGVKTGGWAPRGWKTTVGANPGLAVYGLQEHHKVGYPPRTKQNVNDSDGTLIFATNMNSAGTKMTIRYAEELGKPYHLVPLPPVDIYQVTDEIVKWIKVSAVHTMNVAGNRLNPDYHRDITKFILKHVFTRLRLDGKLR